jgi:2-dehydro-3-deoxyphosphogluconate aldolase / (4S)-4-hydroxy-2-oxoglutarate aldolase
MNMADRLRTNKLLAIVRGKEPEAALRTVMALAYEGIELIEVSLTTADALTVLRRARDMLGPSAALGAGTVISVDDAARAADAGAEFIVTPAVGPGIAEARSRGLPVLAGALTPSEVVEATDRGADVIKLFPASLGGVGYLRALRDPFPTLSFVPVGGVDAVLAQQYLAAGATAVGIGSPLVGDAASGGSIDELRRRARAFLGSVRDLA